MMTTPNKVQARRSSMADDHERRVNTEIEQLLCDIRRIGPTYPDPVPRVLFGELFDDEQVEQYYEALVGTLKSAKKRGIISYKGQMLLKGLHDRVIISIIDDTASLTQVHPNKQQGRSNISYDRGSPLNSVPNHSRHSRTKSTSQYNMNSSLSSPNRKSFNATKKEAANKRHSISLPITKKVSSSVRRPTAKTPPSKMGVNRPFIPVTKSSCSISSEQSQRVDTEVEQLLIDIRRIGVDGQPSVTFGELFDDDDVQQYYEALVGTLKSAKKRGYIDFKGQILLKGMHDKVLISIVHRE